MTISRLASRFDRLSGRLSNNSMRTAGVSPRSSPLKDVFIQINTRIIKVHGVYA